MELKKMISGFWFVFLGETLVARIYLDLWHQVEYLVLFTTDAKLQRQLKELVLFHAQSYVKNRSYSCMAGLLLGTKTNSNLTERDSDYVMNFELIAEDIKTLDDASIDASLEGTVKVIQAKFPTYPNLIKAVLQEIQAETGIQVTMWNPDWDKLLGQDENEIQFHILTAVDTKIRFTVHTENKFRFWKTVHYYAYEEKTNHLLHIVPGYHPQAKKWTQFAMVNGDTDALIGKHDLGIDYICCPIESISGPGSAFGTWSYVNHPYYATGSSFDMKISAIKLLSQEAFDCLKQILLAALEQNDTYISVCGGFNPPYHYPSSNQHEVRGSEHMCVWEFRQLTKEHEIDNAIIPPWFLKEKWLEKYPK